MYKGEGVAKIRLDVGNKIGTPLNLKQEVGTFKYYESDLKITDKATIVLLDAQNRVLAQKEVTVRSNVNITSIGIMLLVKQNGLKENTLELV